MPSDPELETIFSACRSIVGPNTWDQVLETCGPHPGPEDVCQIIAGHGSRLNLPQYLSDLALLEKTIFEINKQDPVATGEVEKIDVNPIFRLLELSWTSLTLLLDQKEDHSKTLPEPGRQFVMVWKDPIDGKTKYRITSDEDLLVLKVVVEGIDPKAAARQGDIPVGHLDAAIDRAVENAILLRPKSLVRRDPGFSDYGKTEDRFLISPSFAVQWHITQKCDLHCKHCYDRSHRSELKFEKAVDFLDALHDFCWKRYVKGHVIFTGGNPLLYPRFSELYRAAVERGFHVAILGNPATRKQIEALIRIKKPRFFQVSLEGLPEHNDMIRGDGHFERVIKFLKVLQELGVHSMVMLTLTRDNIHQVIPLANALREHADAFFFNRLSMVGEGAKLMLPTRDEYESFLKQYMEKAENNSILGLKDNLFNILRHKKDMPLFDGCTGYGCGAAFSFFAVLSDGEVHACRKFPSRIGNIFQQSLDEIYDSESARQYRHGCESCGSCPIKHACGGCLAIAHSYGLNVFEEKDPHCFM